MKKEMVIWKIAKMNSRGQIVIPKELRKDIKKDEIFLLIKKRNQIILRKASSKKMAKDLKSAYSLERAWKQIEQGKCRTMKSEDFLKELKNW